ncbi:MAG: dTDP-4-dehydrorhamnose 3,5-epimerase [Proteobacteria bacterium]|nr:dTDP-4-dehydrorhamnose 3,5-epimerase [Pseudomonadota bacterium]
METTSTALPGLLHIKPHAFRDERGFFFESWQSDRYQALGIPGNHWAQDNVSCSKKGVLRGLHFQFPRGQGKLVTVLQGEVYDVAVDVRLGSPTFGQHLGFNLSDKNFHQLWIPSGFAHGFLVLSDFAIVSYKASGLYYPEDEKTLIWNDPALSISWPRLDVTPTVSAKDLRGLRLEKFSQTDLPAYSP